MSRSLYRVDGDGSLVKYHAVLMLDGSFCVQRDGGQPWDNYRPSDLEAEGFADSPDKAWRLHIAKHQCNVARHQQWIEQAERAIHHAKQELAKLNQNA